MKIKIKWKSTLEKLKKINKKYRINKKTNQKAKINKW